MTNAAVEVSNDAESATGHWYLLQTATLKQTNKAVWLAARYDDKLVFEDGTWLFKRISLRSQFYTSYEAGWARVPHLLEQKINEYRRRENELTLPPKPVARYGTWIFGNLPRALLPSALKFRCSMRVKTRILVCIRVVLNSSTAQAR